MFLDRCLENNRELIDYAFMAHQSGIILPDTYILDLDVIRENAIAMLKEAKANDVELYFMLKQIGRNPKVAKMLMEIGFTGAVAVDFKEALTMIDNDIHIANVGHLVQIPKHCLKKILAARPDKVTVYSLDKIKEIDRVAGELGIVQDLLIRISDEDADLYSGQNGGFLSNDLDGLVDEVERLSSVKISGITAFPALLYDATEDEIAPTSNMNGLKRAEKILRARGYTDLDINIPSATCTASIKTIKELGGKSGEPGHGLSGTTPYHKAHASVEKVGYVYVSEVSHDHKDKAYVYGGGHYRRGHVEDALVGKDLATAKRLKITAPDADSIDYYFELSEKGDVSDTVIMCFRTQMFTTRSHIATVSGIHDGRPEIELYDPHGRKIEVDW